jgi:MFS family permease
MVNSKYGLGDRREWEGSSMTFTTTTGDPAAATGDRPCVDCLEPVDLSRQRAAFRAWPFWFMAYLLTAMMLGTTLPTPLYVIYQEQWHFSSWLITLIYASYAAGVLTSLLLAGRSSDQVGRRPVLGVAIALSALSTVVFILAPGLAWLFVGRVLSGLAAGLVTGTATATLAETVRGSSSRRATQVATAANMGGLGLGPLVAGLFAQFGPNPTVLVFEVYLVLLAVAALGLVVLPESLAVRQRLTLRFTGLGIPTVGRGEFISAGLAVFAAFALLGLFSSLVPSFLSEVLHQQSHAVSGAVVFAMFAAAVVTAVLLSRFATRPVVLSGLSILLPALALIVAGLSQASMVLFLIGTIVGGVSVGAIFIGSLSTAHRLAPVENRGRVVSTYFVFAYVGLTIPVVAVGIAAQNVGDFRAVLVCAIALAVVSIWSFVGIKRGQ